MCFDISSGVCRRENRVSFTFANAHLRAAVLSLPHREPDASAADSNSGAHCSAVPVSVALSIAYPHTSARSATWFSGFGRGRESRLLECDRQLSNALLEQPCRAVWFGNAVLRQHASFDR